MRNLSKSPRLKAAWRGAKRLSAVLFPEQVIFRRFFSWKQKVALFAALAAFFALLGGLLPPVGLVGFDWNEFFAVARAIPFYPPWTQTVTALLSWPLLIGLGLAAFGLAALQRSAHPLSLAAAFLSLPLLWTVFLGQLDGLALLGVLGLPWLAPLALLKPQITFFAFGARPSYLVAFVAVMLVSWWIYGPWWNAMLNIDQYFAEGRYPQNIALGWMGLPLFLATVWFSRGDVDMLMLSGAFITPHLIPYNFLPFSPAIARLSPPAALCALLLSWAAPIFANRLGVAGWWTGWLFPLFLWGALAVQRRRARAGPAGRDS